VLTSRECGVGIGFKKSHAQRERQLSLYCQEAQNVKAEYTYDLAETKATNKYALPCMPRRCIL